ncbi:hypothetical protein OKA04_19230 [Luteolibacter flavescens]|uniref:DUF5615 domain-containing protein n=1 Tax=Luteolibacter flavescens TaxID=1859460 RepID=A0ABT3FUI4_9BACT|nr:hypothetical protein [Luteolibacter flavescens]MCW1886881.1 hypothetical protein [Luteolibacter flavescens]
MEDAVVIDECLPKRLVRLPPGHQVFTVPQLGLAGAKNGKLLQALSGRCRAFITVDSNLSFQQNLPRLPFATLILSAASNRIEDIAPLAPSILTVLGLAVPGSIHHIPSA